MRQSSGGFELTFGPVLLALLGLWLDRRIGTLPLFTVSLTVLGFVGAVVNIYYRYKHDMEAHDARSAAAKAGNPGEAPS